MRIVCISDTHNGKPKVPDGDILIHAGDLTMNGTFMEIVKVGDWLRELPHKHKVVIAGNHDFLFEKDINLAKNALGPGLTYLQDSDSEIEGLKFYGSPWTPRFFDWAFNVDRGQLYRKWNLIPEGLDVLITHGPPAGILDKNAPAWGGIHVGCTELYDAVKLVRPKLHVFGHIHESNGRLDQDGTIFVNAAVGYRLEHKAVVVDL